MPANIAAWAWEMPKTHNEAFLQLARTLTSTPAHVAAEKKTAQARQTDNIQ